MEGAVRTSSATDYNSLLSSAGDAFSQFQFAEEREWDETGSDRQQISALSIDCDVLANALHKLPLHLLLGLEPDVIQSAAPTELRKFSLFDAPKLAFSKTSKLEFFLNAATKAEDPSSPSSSSLSFGPKSDCAAKLASFSGDSTEKDDTFEFPQPTTESRGGAVEQEGTARENGRPLKTPEKVDEELELLLTLEEPAALHTELTNMSLNHLQSDSSEIVQAGAATKTEEMTQVLDKQENEPTVDDLEDWLDSLIQ
uniref:cell death regulator Aven-like n=1 Tax=Myxine glutinosa TaxID=7769 RepID=UPI00358E858C